MDNKTFDEHFKRCKDAMYAQMYNEQLLATYLIAGKFNCHGHINCSWCRATSSRLRGTDILGSGVCGMGSIDHSKGYKYSARCKNIIEYCKHVNEEHGFILTVNDDLNYEITQAVTYDKEAKVFNLNEAKVFNLNNAKGQILNYRPSAEQIQPECKIHYHNDNPYEVKYQTSGAVGFDLALPKHCKFQANKPFKEPLDISFEIPEGYYIEIHPRSSTLIKHNLLCNIGIIDTDYTGIVHLTGMSLYDYSLPAGTRLCQAILKKKYIASNIVVVNQERDQNGFGGTDK